MFLPTSRREMDERGIEACDVVIVTPDAYIDHPSFAMAVLGRFLEENGYKTGIISQPRWKDPQSFLELGRPKIAFAVSGGQADSMVINYTAAGIPRKEDRFCEEGNPFFSKKGEGKKYRIRPDRTIPVYSNQIKAACRNVPVIIGGIEASLRRIAHYDFWSDSIKRSILLDAKADLLIYGMGEYPMLETVELLESGVTPADIRARNTAIVTKTDPGEEDAEILPSFEEIESSKEKFAESWTLFENNSDKKVLTQSYGTRNYMQQPAGRLTQKELDSIYDIDFERKPHPRYSRVPAFDMIESSVTSHRGCYGNCSFCSISAHQGKEIVSRSRESILKEVGKIARSKNFRGTITDIGGPTANMYGSRCSAGGCTEHDCLKEGEGCKNLVPGTAEYISILEDALSVKGVRNVQINSGIRFEPCILDDRTLKAICERHISGRMKAAPESGSRRVLAIMNKPEPEIFEDFYRRFSGIKKALGKKASVRPYTITGHPGEGDKEAHETCEFLRNFGLSAQSQIFTPTPMTRSTAIYYLGYDPKTGERIYTEKNRKKLEARKMELPGCRRP